ncbi:hypothetical protein LCGC14_1423700 [marine sediment metagenome]|uniref:Uncharacterized protein n=1 Tax=marine sediment metagenome TaxID=412755 RepID=A0A0F9MSA0_9ZZZZ
MSYKTDKNRATKERDAAKILDALCPYNTPESGIYKRLHAKLMTLDRATLGDLALPAGVITARRNRIAREAAEEGRIISDQSLPNLGRKTQ